MSVFPGPSRVTHVRDSVGGRLLFATTTHKAHTATATGITCIARDRPANQPVVATGNRFGVSRKDPATNDNNPKRRSNHSQATVPIAPTTASAVTFQFVDPLLNKNGTPSKRPATTS